MCEGDDETAAQDGSVGPAWIGLAPSAAVIYTGSSLTELGGARLNQLFIFAKLNKVERVQRRGNAGEMVEGLQRTGGTLAGLLLEEEEEVT